MLASPCLREIMPRMMDMITRMTTHFEDAINVQTASRDTLAPLLVSAVDLLFNAVTNGAKILACGNGGSASDAQHFVAELVGRFEQERLPLAAIALNTDTAILTAVGNDYGYEEIFARQVMALGHPGDVLVAISTSGDSVNILHAIRVAHEREMNIIALTGKGGGEIGKSLPPNQSFFSDQHEPADQSVLSNAHLSFNYVHLCVPSTRTMRIQEVHGMLLHAMCDGIDLLLLGTCP